MTTATVIKALEAVHRRLAALGAAHALVGGLAVSARAQPRATRDVDLAVSVADDTEAEALVRELRAAGYTLVAVVEHERNERLATARLQDPHGVVIDLLFATSGIEGESVARAEPVELADDLVLPVARAEELVAMKVLAMAPRRETDARDARWMIEADPGLDLVAVRANLALIRERGFDRGEDLEGKLEQVLALVRAPK